MLQFLEENMTQREDGVYVINTRQLIDRCQEYSLIKHRDHHSFRTEIVIEGISFKIGHIVTIGDDGYHVLNISNDLDGEIWLDLIWTTNKIKGSLIRD